MTVAAFTVVTWLAIVCGSVMIGMWLGARWAARHTGREAGAILRDFFDGMEKSTEFQREQQRRAEASVSRVDLRAPTETPDAGFIIGGDAIRSRGIQLVKGG